MRALIGLAMLTALSASARAENWTARGCGEAPSQPHYDLSSRATYNDAVKQANAYAAAARNYSTCVLGAAHDDQAAISRQAQNRIADIQATAVATQQTLYGRLAAQAAQFKAAAARLKRP